MEAGREPKHDVESRLPDDVVVSADTGSDISVLEEKREKHLIRKIDLHILPFVVLLYLFSFLDRGMLFINLLSGCRRYGI